MDVMAFSLPRACCAQWTSQAPWEVFFQQLFEFCMPSHSLHRLAEVVPSKLDTYFCISLEHRKTVCAWHRARS